jgi:adenine-specific DNA-methyltransferase
MTRYRKRSDFIRQRNSSWKDFSNNAGWVILDDLEAGIKAKIERIGTPLKDWDIQINYGIKTGYNDAFIIGGEKRRELINKCPKAAEIIRPILRGKDIHRYYHDKTDQWVIYIPWHFPLHEDQDIKGASLHAEEVFKKEYPEVYMYLLKHKTQLENRNKAETGIRYEWYALQRFGSNYWKDFAKKKIVWGNLSLKGAYSLVDEGVYINAPSTFIPSDNLYLLAVLNSKLADFYIKQLGVSRSGGYFEYKPMFVEQLPVPIVAKEIENSFSEIVKKILETKNFESTELNDKIDELVFDLFGMTENERQAILEFSSNLVSEA